MKNIIQNINKIMIDISFLLGESVNDIRCVCCMDINLSMYAEAREE